MTGLPGDAALIARAKLRLKDRIDSLVNRGAEICGEFFAPAGEVFCARCHYSADVHLLRDLAVVESGAHQPIGLSRLAACAHEVSRLEVIGESGRLLTLRPVQIHMVSFQDDGRTLKLFTKQPEGEGRAHQPEDTQEQRYSASQIYEALRDARIRAVIGQTSDGALKIYRGLPQPATPAYPNRGKK